MLLKETVPLRPGDTVLFHAAAGGVGLLFAQWARALGIQVIGTVSDDAKAAVARHAGCVEVIDYVRQDFVERVRAITNGEGVAAVFDAVGRDTFLKSLETLRPRGVLAAFGKASGDPPALDPFLLAPKSLYVTWPIRPNYTASRQQLEASAADLFDAIGKVFSTSAQTAPTPSTISFRAIAIWRAERSSALRLSSPEAIAKLFP
jgi:NADPH2:quinone reductase